MPTPMPLKILPVKYPWSKKNPPKPKKILNNRSPHRKAALDRPNRARGSSLFWQKVFHSLFGNFSTGMCKTLWKSVDTGKKTCFFAFFRPFQWFLRRKQMPFPVENLCGKFKTASFEFTISFSFSAPRKAAPPRLCIPRRGCRRTLPRI